MTSAMLGLSNDRAEAEPAERKMRSKVQGVSISLMEEMIDPPQSASRSPIRNWERGGGEGGLIRRGGGPSQ